MQINIVNIASFYQNAEELVSHIKSYKPGFIIVDWCFATNGGRNFIPVKSTVTLTKVYILHIFCKRGPIYSAQIKVKYYF